MAKTLLILLVNEKYFFVTDIKQITVIATFWYYNCELQSHSFVNIPYFVLYFTKSSQTMWIKSLVVARQNVPITFIHCETTLS